ncbi:MAG: rhamnulokinase [Clostridia bacterium]|nr:rhamnulokinase [Clostridia bacterium]
MKYYMEIDIGASSGRHIVGWLEDGKLKTEEVYRFSNGTEVKKGQTVWNTKRLFDEIKNGLRAAKQVGKTPSYVGVDTWAVDYALLDKEDRLIEEVYAYRDNRTIKAVDRVRRIISFNELYKRTGIQFQQFNTVYQLYADKLSGKLESAQSMLMLPDYLNFLLTGVKKQEYTNATSTGLVNAETHDWDAHIIEITGLPAKLFGKLSQPGTVVGEFTEDIRKEVGYNATVILPATHDTASAVLAAPIEEESPYISSGTWSLLGIEQTKAHTDEFSKKANYSNEGSIGYGFRYQKNIMGLWLIQNVRKELGNPSFETLTQMAKCKEDCGVIDVNDKRFLSPKNMTAEINKALGKSLNSASIMRVIYDSLAKSYADAIAELERNTGKTYKTLNIIGGGSRDTLLNELTAKATGKKVITGPTEATALGNIVMQMIGIGELKDLAEARRIIKQSFEIREVQ